MTHEAHKPKLSISKPDGYGRFVLSADGVEISKYEFSHSYGGPIRLEVLDQEKSDAFDAWVKGLSALHTLVPGEKQKCHLEVDDEMIVHTLYNEVEFGVAPDMECLR